MALKDWLSNPETSATPATSATPKAGSPLKRAENRLTVASVASVATVSESYTTADLEEMDRLLRELAKMEDWSEAELADKLDQRQRMAPVNVPALLREIRAAHGAALAVWPERTLQRSQIVLCRLQPVELAVIDGGRS